MIRTKNKLVSDTGVTILPELKTNDHDVKYTGGEPVFYEQPSESKRKFILVESFNWYSRYFDKKKAKELLIEFCENNKFNASDIKKIKSVNEKEYNSPICWLSRLSNRGLSLTDSEKDVVMQEVKRLVNVKQKDEVIDVAEEKALRPSIQDIMKEKASEVAGELEGIFDQFVIDGSKTIGNIRVIDELSKKNILPQHVNILVDVWKRKKNEFEEVIDGKDKELVQGYSNFNKTQLKNCVKFCDQVLSDFNSYVSIKKTTKSPRARKPVPIEKIVKDVKYLKTFKEGKLELNSLPPSKLHGCSEAYIYDTELRKLIYLIADDYVKTLSVKGTSILGFDTVKSQVKTIRKPLEMLSQFMKLGKPAGRKYFDEIKTLGVTPKGRMNERMVILKAW